MKVLLVYPFHTATEKGERWYSVEPLGLLCLATYLKRAAERDLLDIDIRVLDAQFEGPDECTMTKRGYRSGMTDEQLQSRITEWMPDVVGIANSYTSGAGDAFEISDIVKSCVPGTKVIMGGAHASIDHMRVAQVPSVDAVVRGEGEETLREICCALLAGRSFTDIPGVTWRTPDGICRNPDRQPIQDLDTLPIPDRSFIPYALYHTHPAYVHTRQKPVGTVSTSRGCPFQCVFCSTQKVWGNKWRGRSAESMIREVEYLRDTYGIKEVAFQDDQFLGDRNRIIRFCQLAVEKKLGVTFIVPPGNSPSFMSEELLKWMAKAGFYRICFSVDAGTEAAVKYVKKPVKLSQIRSLVKLAHRYGIWTYGTFVIGFPYEAREDILATVRYAYSLKLDFLRFYIAQPHLGSELYERYVQEGRLSDTNVNESRSMYDALFGTEHLSAEELIAMRNAAECNYFRSHFKDYLNPVFVLTEFLPKILSPARFRYFSGLILCAFKFSARYDKARIKSDKTP